MRNNKKITQLYLVVLALFVLHPALAQGDDNYSDMLLTDSFKLYREADFEMAYHIFPFLKERFLEQLEDSTSFANPYQGLSEYMGILRSSDSLVRTYSWSERDSGCCHSSETYAQFKTTSGVIKYVDLEAMENDAGEVFITDLQKITISKKPYYLILGNGTCCGGKHYSTARVYEITKDSLRRCEAVFNEDAEIYAGANRGQRIGLSYDPETETLSHNGYKMDEETGFYDREKTVVQWKLTKNGFRKMK
ncbi:hypothetical protein [Maribacter sp. 2-571]|uniref:hypothetical protein n=1 Tax=Maribacter sp. 2-571 TaxID=3417569 RepID=UPI003D32D846